MVFEGVHQELDTLPVAVFDFVVEASDFVGQIVEFVFNRSNFALEL